MLDLQKLTIRRLLESSSTEFYSKLNNKYFSGSNLLLFTKIQNFYRKNLRVPSIDEFLVIKKEVSLKDYFESQILDEANVNEFIENEFLIGQLQDYCIRDETIEFLSNFLDDLDDLEGVEIMDKFQNHLLNLNNAVPMTDELIDVGTMETVPTADTFVMYPTGLSHEYDNVNGGFALQEFVAIGGRRGSGKSILALNAALNRFLKNDSTSAFFSIEMRYLEVYYRTMSIISNVPFLDFMMNRLTPEQKVHIGKKKLEAFYEPSGIADEIHKQLAETKNVELFDHRLRTEEVPMKDNRFFIIDDPSLTLNRIDHYCNVFTNKYPNFTMATVDYLNIINTEDSKDWKTQIIMAESLKGMARKYNVTMLSPYQVDATLEARYAKGILDSADRAFVFQPKSPDDQDADVITLYTAKVRNGKNITFDIGMDWENTRVDPTRNTTAINQNTDITNKSVRFGPGDGHEENSRDV